jgi:hypothetical protein
MPLCFFFFLIRTPLLRGNTAIQVVFGTKGRDAIRRELCDILYDVRVKEPSAPDELEAPNRRGAKDVGVVSLSGKASRTLLRKRS